MDFFFQPKGVAVIGASPSPDKGGNMIISNLQKGYPGEIYPVNPRYDKINGLTCYASILDVPDPVDLAIVYVGAQMVPQTIQDCAMRGIPGAMLQSAGFSETGPEGARLQDETARIAKKTGIRLWGPNCMGLVDAVHQIVFSTVTPTLWSAGLTPGRVSLIVQSGMLTGAFLIDIMTHGAMGISKACSIGNKMDIDESDLLEYLLDDPDTHTIGLYLESILDGPRFINLCRCAAKPIVVLKGGKSARGAQAALSHTASLAGNGAVVSGALAQAGVVEAKDFYQMMDLCRVLEAYAGTVPARGNQVAILTYSGGAGIVSTDFLEELGLSLAVLSQGSLEMLQTVYPAWMVPGNPMDLWPGIIGNGSLKVYNEAVRAACSDPGVHGIFAHCFAGGFALEPDLPTMARLAREAGKPLICWISGEREAVHQFQVKAQKLNVPVFREIYRALECLGVLLGRTASPVITPAPAPELEFPADLVPMGSDRAVDLDEHRSKQILAAAGIPVIPEQLTDTVQAALSAAASFKFPVVLKGVAPGMIHKTESGLVRLNIASDQQLKAAFDQLMETLQHKGKVLVQAQAAGGLELIVGLIRDPQFGLCVMCGLGGILTELLEDSAFAVAPITQAEALSLISRLKNQKVLNGFRGAKPLDRNALADILVRMGGLGRQFSQVAEVDINPLIVVEGQPVAVDAAIILQEKV